uniref:putative endogenous retrovirus group FC1 Env polyprotein n=1 Tax=Jaculus jaculus TaxID=51337 RepID=UPI001E1B57B8|nr:putative endogenous retrovirus group FC1 Env polyprotein [Jaculus jaculus]
MTTFTWCLLLLIHLPAAWPFTSPLAWRFYLTENWTTYDQTKQFGHILATADYPPTGCAKPILLNFTDFKHHPNKVAPILYFLFDQKHDKCKTHYIEESVRCPWHWCTIWSASVPAEGQILGTGWSGHKFWHTDSGYSLIIWDAWDSCWTSMVQGAMYMNKIQNWPFCKIYIWHSYVQVQSKVYSNILQAEK